MAQQKAQPVIIVGLDFGTTFSGFAIAEKGDILTPPRFFVDWPPLSGPLMSTSKPYCKTSSCLYYNYKGDGQLKLKSWGWPAKSRHANALTASIAVSGAVSGISYLTAGGTSANASQEHSDVPLPEREGRVESEARARKVSGELVTHFKLLLGGTGVGGHSRGLVDPLPDGLNAEQVISDYLSKIGHFALVEVNRAFEGRHFEMTDLQWIVTIPSIWDDRLKQQMKQCMIRAHLVQPRGGENNGGSRHELMLVLEPEAGSIYARSSAHWPAEVPRLTPGDRFVVVDAGGGTVDLVGQVATRQRRQVVTKELTESSGDAYGGIFIDKNFEKYVSERIPVFHEYMEKNPVDMIYFMQQWHAKAKNTFRGDANEGIVLDLSSSLAETWEAHIQASGVEVPETGTDEIHLTSENMREIFDPVVDKILNLIEEQVRKIGQCKAILMVGGLSESVYLRQRVKMAHPGIRVIKPENPGAAVCIGAAMFGLNPKLVASRISRKTYGIAVMNGSFQLSPAFFLAKLGPPLILQRDGPDLFLTFVKKEDEVGCDSCVRHVVHPSHPDGIAIEVELFSTLDREVEFTNEAGVEKEGSFTFLIPDTRKGLDRDVEIQMYFGRSSVEVTARALNFKNGRHADGALWAEFSATDAQ